MKRVIYLILIIVLIVAVSGCGNSGISAHDYLEQALTKNKSINDLQFSGKLNAPAEDSTFSFTGRLEQRPLYLDSEVRIITTMQGVNLLVDFPMLVTDGELYIKVPAILQEQIPELNRDYVMFTAHAGSQTSFYDWLIGAVSNLSADEVVRVKTKGFSFATGRVNEAIEIRTDRMSGFGPFAEMTEIVATLVFDKNDYLRKLNFQAGVSLQDSTDQLQISGEIDLTKINEGIANKLQKPAADEVVNYDEVNFPPIIGGGKLLD